RPHISSPRDLILLALYLSGILGAALGGLEFLCDTLLAKLARQGLVLVGQVERLAARVGLLFFVATALYLAFVVRGGRTALLSVSSAGRGAQGAAWILWLMAVIGALAVAHVIGRIARFGSLIAMVAAGGGGDLAGRLGVPARARTPLIF